jgi:hypothetical protein
MPPVCLNDEQQRPSVEKTEDGMQCLAQIFVLAAHFRDAVAEFRIDERAEDCDYAAGDPNGQDQHRGMKALSDHVGVHEDTGADDAAHHHHGCVEEAELA